MKILSNKKFQKFSYLGLKLALSFAFLSAVADRFGLWGKAQTEGIFWGNFENFISYTKLLNPWAPDFLASALAWIATILEIILGLLLLTNFKTREVSFVSGALLTLFGLSMVITLGPKASLDYSVFSAAFAAFYLSSRERV